MKNKLRFKLKSNIKDKNFKGTVKIGLLCVYDSQSSLNIQYGEVFYRNVYNITHKVPLRNLEHFDLDFSPNIQCYYKSLYFKYNCFTNINIIDIYLIDANRQFINVHPV